MNRVFTTVLLSILFTSCGGSDSESDSFEQSISGTWSKCTNFENTSELYRTTQEDNVWTDTIIRHIDLDCMTVDDNREPEIFTGTYQIGNELESENLESVYEVIWFNDDPDVRTCYSIIGVDGDMMFFAEFGGENDCTSPEERHMTLDYESPFFRE